MANKRLTTNVQCECERMKVYLNWYTMIWFIEFCSKVISKIVAIGVFLWRQIIVEKVTQIWKDRDISVVSVYFVRDPAWEYITRRGDIGRNVSYNCYTCGSIAFANSLWQSFIVRLWTRSPISRNALPDLAHVRS